MKEFFEELFAYNLSMNEKVAELIIKKEEILPAKAIELFSHILNAHHIWNSRIINQKPTYSVWQTQPTSEFRSIISSNQHATQAILNNENLNKTIAYKMSTGQPFDNSISDILFHIINHSNYHRAQIATIFKETGVTPPSTDYIFFKR